MSNYTEILDNTNSEAKLQSRRVTIKGYLEPKPIGEWRNSDFSVIQGYRQVTQDGKAELAKNIGKQEEYIRNSGIKVQTRLAQLQTTEEWPVVMLNLLNMAPYNAQEKVFTIQYLLPGAVTEHIYNGIREWLATGTVFTDWGLLEKSSLMDGTGDTEADRIVSIMARQVLLIGKELNLVASGHTYQTQIRSDEKFVDDTLVVPPLGVKPTAFARKSDSPLDVLDNVMDGNCIVRQVEKVTSHEHMKVAAIATRIAGLKDRLIKKIVEINTSGGSKGLTEKDAVKSLQPGKKFPTPLLVDMMIEENKDIVHDVALAQQDKVNLMTAIHLAMEITSEDTTRSIVLRSHPVMQTLMGASNFHRLITQNYGRGSLWGSSLLNKVFPEDPIFERENKFLGSLEKFINEYFVLQDFSKFASMVSTDARNFTGGASGVCHTMAKYFKFATFNENLVLNAGIHYSKAKQDRDMTIISEESSGPLPAIDLSLFVNANLNRDNHLSLRQWVTANNISNGKNGKISLRKDEKLFYPTAANVRSLFQVEPRLVTNLSLSARITWLFAMADKVQYIGKGSTLFDKEASVNATEDGGSSLEITFDTSKNKNVKIYCSGSYLELLAEQYIARGNGKYKISIERNLEEDEAIIKTNCIPFLEAICIPHSYDAPAVKVERMLPQLTVDMRVVHTDTSKYLRIQPLIPTTNLEVAYGKGDAVKNYEAYFMDKSNIHGVSKNLATQWANYYVFDFKSKVVYDESGDQMNPLTVRVAMNPFDLIELDFHKCTAKPYLSTGEFTDDNDFLDEIFDTLAKMKIQENDLVRLRSRVDSEVLQEEDKKVQSAKLKEIAAIAESVLHLDTSALDGGELASLLLEHSVRTKTRRESLRDMLITPLLDSQTAPDYGFHENYVLAKDALQLRNEMEFWVKLRSTLARGIEYKNWSADRATAILTLAEELSYDQIFNLINV